MRPSLVTALLLCDTASAFCYRHSKLSNGKTVLQMCYWDYDHGFLDLFKCGRYNGRLGDKDSRGGTLVNWTRVNWSAICKGKKAKNSPNYPGDACCEEYSVGCTTGEMRLWCYNLRVYNGCGSQVIEYLGNGVAKVRI
ncbi:hypothetical protein CDD81_2220 [Ophiocordyceps australis]|uniref:Cyanovirin-N domain-containing protein n=1 Tax=Ophiocordyceps australis TaxID=1399860 RepID=A0A2C5XX36_9HYPO|nr:hypothetical protein CDD81_2220 [Ophiocordyceps australis]